MIVSINQPAYLPWLGYFHRIGVSDLHVVLDHVQFEKNSFTNRNKVRSGPQATWLTVPLRTKGRFGALAINQVEVAEDTRWETKHLATIEQNYSRAPFFEDYRTYLRATYKRSWHHLIDVIDNLTAHLLASLRIETPLVRSSDLGVPGSKDDLVLNLCREVGATVYLSGPLGRDYLDETRFADAGIELRYHDYRHPEYPQVQGGFVPYLTVLDLLLNCGPASFAILSGGQEVVV